MSLLINKLLSEKIIKKALSIHSFKARDKDGNILEKLKQCDKTKIISVWKPASTIHLIDIIVARVLSSIAVLDKGNDDKKINVKVYFSNYPKEKNQQAITKYNEEATFYYSLFSELYHKFCGNDLVRLRRIFSSESGGQQKYHCGKKVLEDYDSFMANEVVIKKRKDRIARKVREKQWPQDTDYMASILGLLIKERPEYILCGQNHEWIWMDGLIGEFFSGGDYVKPQPEMLYVKKIKGLNGEEHNESKDDTCIKVESSYLQIIQKLFKVNLEKNEYIARFMMLYCFLYEGYHVKINNTEIKTFKKWLSYITAPSSGMASKKATAAGIIHGSLNEVRNIEQLHRRITSPPIPKDISNSTVIDYIENRFRFSSDPFEIRDGSIIDVSPLEYIEGYKKSLAKVCKRYENYGSYLSVIGLVEKSSLIDNLPFLFEKRHRDHFSHQFNVYGIGVILLDTIVKGNKTLKEVVQEILSPKSIEDVEYLWLVTALLHDHAYPLEYYFKISPLIKIQRLYSSRSSKEGIAGLGKAIEEVLPDIYCKQLTQIMSKDRASIETVIHDIYRGMFPEREEMLTKQDLLNHGVIAAVNLYKKANGNELFDPVYDAIAKHHGKEKLSFNEKPLGTLLKFCDELHEWGRPTLTNDGYQCAIKKITLNLKLNLNGDYEMPEDLSIEFCCNSKDILDKLQWREDIFWKGKQEVMSTIGFTFDDQNPKKIVMSLVVPSAEY